MTTKELISTDRKIVCIKKEGKSLKFYYDFEKPTEIIKKVLRLPNYDPIEIDPKSFPHLDIFVQVLSNNKTYKKGSVFLYQVFPSDIMFYHKFLLKAVREKDYEAVFHLIEFFNAMEMNFINLKEAGTLNTALHVAAANGFYAIALLLLENYANVNQKNKSGNTPLFVAALAMHRDITKVLLEFGADVSIKNGAKHSLLTQFMSGDYRMFLDACVLRLNTIYSGCFNGNSGALKQVIDEHADNSFPLCTLRSRFIDGSTLLHKCVLYNHYAQIERLLNMVDFDGKMLNPNTRDSRGCTALHVCKNADIMRMLIEYGADVNVVNLDGNMPIHLKCLGEKHKPSQLDCVELLMFFKSELRYKNKEKMLPMHMAAMQGRIDVIQLLLKQEPEHSVMIALNKDLVQISLSFPYVALINDQLDCAAWLINKGFELRSGEANTIAYKILTEQTEVKNMAPIVSFLCHHGCQVNKRYEKGNTLLHFAAGMPGERNDVIQALIDRGAAVNGVNEEGKTPLFASVENNNPIAAATLLRNAADYLIANVRGYTAFDLLKDVDDWARSDFFDSHFQAVIKSYEHRQIKLLIRSVSDRVKYDFSSKAGLIERSQVLDSYLKNHYKVFNAGNAIPVSQRY